MAGEAGNFQPLDTVIEVLETNGMVQELPALKVVAQAVVGKLSAEGAVTDTFAEDGDAVLDLLGELPPDTILVQQAPPEDGDVSVLYGEKAVVGVAVGGEEVRLFVENKQSHEPAHEVAPGIMLTRSTESHRRALLVPRAGNIAMVNMDKLAEAQIPAEVGRLLAEL